MAQVIDGVRVEIDDRVRLMSALLAMTSWPEDEQTRKPHGTHAHARGTRRFLLAQAKHPAVLILQALLDRGVPLSAIYGYIMMLSWPGLAGEDLPNWAPPTWPRHLLDFYSKSELIQWWNNEKAVWNSSETQALKMFNGTDLRGFLKPFVGAFEDDLLFVPNVCYPSDQEIGIAIPGQLCCVVPPRIAWGDNPPWPFDEDPTHIFRAALLQYGLLLMKRYLHAHEDVLTAASQKKLPIGRQLTAAYPTWEEQFLALFGAGLVAIYLEDAVNTQEAEAYVLMEKKAQGLTELPGVVSVLRRYLQGYEEGKYAEFADFLPHFGKHLRVAKTITAL
ncbi:hypothetical protein ACFLYO_04135 [Chloroflexota bacterium]